MYIAIISVAINVVFSHTLWSLVESNLNCCFYVFYSPDQRVALFWDYSVRHRLEVCMSVMSVCMYHVVVNIAEFSPSSDGNYPSSGGSPQPNKAQSPQNNFGNL